MDTDLNQEFSTEVIICFIINGLQFSDSNQTKPSICVEIMISQLNKKTINYFLQKCSIQKQQYIMSMNQNLTKMEIVHRSFFLTPQILLCVPQCVCIREYACMFVCVWCVYPSAGSQIIHELWHVCGVQRTALKSQYILTPHICVLFLSQDILHSSLYLHSHCNLLPHYLNCQST